MQNQDTAALNGVMLNIYPDSIGNKLSGTIEMLKMPEFKKAFDLLYILPTFFNSDLDRGFSIIDYDINKDLVSKKDLENLSELNVLTKYDIVLNHLSVASPQFKDLLKNGSNSKYVDFFINWNSFWKGHGKKNSEGVVIPKKEFLDKLFMRKSGLPILKLKFPDGSEQPYWNTFYQKTVYNELNTEDLKDIKELSQDQIQSCTELINTYISANKDFRTIHFDFDKKIIDKIFDIIDSKKSYLGQMDVNAKSKLVWDYYEETLYKLKSYGCKILRLDAFAYLHKEVGESNFFNKPGTWEHLEKINQIAKKNDLLLLPEIHSEYGLGLHDEVAKKGYYIYDFFLPGLILHTLENKTNKALIEWTKEIISKKYKTINMLGCHDGIPLLDIKGKEVNGIYKKGLISDEEIELLMNLVISRGGKVKNLYDADGKKISYYQVNATYFSALGEDNNKMLLARAIQLFMPGIPQVWYLDVFAGKNDYEAVKKGGSGAHKEINRTNLTLDTVTNAAKTEIVNNQLKLIKLRNTHKAFLGSIEINNTNVDDTVIDIKWLNNKDYAHFKADLKTLKFKINYTEGLTIKSIVF